MDTNNRTSGCTSAPTHQDSSSRALTALQTEFSSISLQNTASPNPAAGESEPQATDGAFNGNNLETAGLTYCINVECAEYATPGSDFCLECFECFAQPQSGTELLGVEEPARNAGVKQHKSPKLGRAERSSGYSLEQTIASWQDER